MMGISRQAWLLGAAGIPLVLTLATARAEEKPGRYTMMPTDGGFVRLDTETGVTSFCKQANGAWACEAMPDGQQKLRDDVTRLEQENAALKSEMKQMEEMLGVAGTEKPAKPGEPAPGAAPGGPMSPETGPPGPPGPKMQIPTEQDVDRMFDYIEGMVRKFKDRIERMEKDLPPDAPGDKAPNADPAEPGAKPTTPL
ncbi:MAG: hypothetical protein NW216_02305 [Hyphomicrobium sp.]|nr:hypothetical protein [Hyphomicrobium sp.]